MTAPKRIMEAILRQDFSSFIHKSFTTINPGSEFTPNWHIDLIAEYLEAVRAGQIKRLIINMPPRALKSVCVNVAWPAWLLGQNPACRIMAASYSQVLSVKHSLDTRFILNSNWYQKIFKGTRLSLKQNQKSKFMTTKYGFRFATSVGGSATGEGGDFLIIDDPHNPVHIHSPRARDKVINWYEQTFSTRLNNRSKGGVVLVMQRLHEEDLAGHLLKNHANEWELLKIPSLAHIPTIFSFNKFNYIMDQGEMLNKNRDCASDIERLAKEIGQVNFAAQYQQEPVASSNNIIKFEWLIFYDQPPEKLDLIVQSWDTAVKINDNADYSVCTTWGIKEGNYYLLDCFERQLEYPQLKREVITLYNKYNPHKILIEDKASGQSLIQDLRNEGLNIIVPCRPTNDKITRLASCSDLFEKNKIYISSIQGWRVKVIMQLTNFPNVKHDDIVDSVSQFLNYIKVNNYQLVKPKIRSL